MVRPISDFGDALRPTSPTLLVVARSRAAINRGDLIAAGCLLRQAVRDFAWALVELHRLEIDPKRRATKKVLVRLRDEGRLPAMEAQWLHEALHFGNCSAHCDPPEEHLLRAALMMIEDLAAHETGVDFPVRKGGLA
ncbi:MAG: hypothetical protein KDA61_04875 [Planctomycetales bacterium]|nr:hypothetical protein [Planctomycetales bacterium]